MRVRELGPDDAAAFWALRLRGFREEPTAFGSSFEEASQLPAEHARHILTCGGRASADFVLGAFEGDVLVGIAGLRGEERGKRAHRATLWGMYVAAEARGRGVGQALLDALLARARRVAGLARVNLTVMTQNAAAIGLYRSRGFEVWGCERDAMRLAGAAYDEYSMAVAL